MRTPLLLILGAVAVMACGRETAEVPRLELSTKAPMDHVATCISQNYDNVFPRLFPTQEKGAAKVFGTYNGIKIVVTDEGQLRRVSMLAAKEPTARMRSYLQKCVRMAEAA